MKTVSTLLIIYQHPRVLLGMKKIGFGKGKWNGFGGKVEDGESIEDATKREAKEEAGIIVSRIEKRGIFIFKFQDKPDVLEMHIFYADAFEGEPKETDEMKPRWFDIQNIPFSEMWADDKYWFPLLLQGKKFKGESLFQDDDHMISHTLNEVEKL